MLSPVRAVVRHPVHGIGSPVGTRVKASPMTALPDARVNKNADGPGIRAKVQKFGGFLAGMIMPNIGAFIAWGLITALFIKVGWLPNETLAALVDPMIIYLLPLLIGYTGGRMVHAQRGAVIGAIATMGVIVGSDIPMFLGAMIMGPLAAWVLKQFDKAVEGKVRSGFEMLVDNFSLGIIGMIMAILATYAIGPAVAGIVGVLSAGVNVLVTAGLLPLVSIFVEPGKVLFLNNAINHGIFTPLAVPQVQETGRSILFMVESNPGAGLGLLLAFMFFGPKSLRKSTSGAVVIHFFGGIHEIFFPYILMKPVMILATIAGSMSGLFVGVLMKAGLVAAASPGSIFAYVAVTPKDGFPAMFTMVATAAIVSFVVAAALLKFGRGSDDTAEVEAKAAAAAAEAGEAGGGTSVNGRDVKKLIIACDAGMGSSVMVASSMKKKLAPYGIEVTHTPVDLIPADAQVVLTQEGLFARAVKQAPHAAVVPFTNYMGDPAFAKIEDAIAQGLTINNGGAITGTATAAAAPVAAAAPAAAPKPKAKKRLQSNVLSRESVRLGLTASDKADAIRQAGEVLVSVGAADPQYIDGMFAREEQTTTFLGNGVAIPHGTNESRVHIKSAALGFLQFPEGVDWDGKTAHVVIPIASNSGEHVGILQALAVTISDKATMERLKTTTSVDEVLDLLTPEED